MIFAISNCAGVTCRSDQRRGNHVGQRMVRGLLGVRIVLARVGKNVGRPRQRTDLDLLHLLRLQVVRLHDIEHRGNRRVGQRLGGKRLHAALRDAPRFAQPVGQQIQLPGGTEDSASILLCRRPHAPAPCNPSRPSGRPARRSASPWDRRCSSSWSACRR